MAQKEWFKWFRTQPEAQAFADEENASVENKGLREFSVQPGKTWEGGFDVVVTRLKNQFIGGRQPE